MEVPRYSIKPNIIRVLVPQTTGLFALAGIFYVLLMASVSLMYQISTMTNYIIVAGLLVLLIAEIIVNYMKKNNMRYDFFNDNMVVKSYGKEKSVLYNEIPGISFEKNLLDRLFRTVTVVLTPEFKIKFINDENKIHFNIQKLIQRSRKLGAINET